MKTIILLPALGLAALGLAACGPKTEAGNTATDTVTLNADDAGLGNDPTPADGNIAADDAALTVNGTDDAVAPAAGNAL